MTRRFISVATLAAVLGTALVVATGSFAKNMPKASAGKRLVVGLYKQIPNSDRTSQLFRALRSQPLYDYGRTGFAAWLSDAKRCSLQKMPDLELVDNGSQFIIGLQPLPAGTTSWQAAQQLGAVPDYGYGTFAGFAARLTAQEINIQTRSPLFAQLRPAATSYSVRLKPADSQDADAVEAELSAKYGFKISSHYTSPANPATGEGPLVEFTAQLNPIQLAGLDNDPRVGSLSFAQTASVPEAIQPLPKPAAKCN